MPKFNKFIIPLAIVKIILAFLVLQLFFSSCEDENILYDGDLFTEGPVFEILAQLGDEDNVFETGDTLFLEIALESNILYDEISRTDITLSNPEFHTQFVILDADGEVVFPSYLEVAGKIDSLTSEVFNASFGTIQPSGKLMSTVSNMVAHLKVGFVFETSGDYTFYFINTPSNLMSTGAVDLFFDRNPDDLVDVKRAYAFFLFDLDGRSQDYGGTSYDANILPYAGYDQAIMDFTIIKRN